MEIKRLLESGYIIIPDTNVLVFGKIEIEQKGSRM